MDRFEPIHDAHAIEQVALAALVSQPLEDAELTAALTAMEKFRADFPGTQQIQFHSITIGSLGLPPRGPTGPFGKLFTRSRPDGSVESELRVDRSGIAFRTTAYTRWPRIWEQIRPYFEELVPLYTARGEIFSVALNYIDKFYWDGDPARMRPDALLRRGSPYISTGIFEATDLWHSHMGMFCQVSEFIKRLVNVNLDCADENQPAQRRTVTVTTVLTDMLNQPGYSPARLGGRATEFFCDRATTLHVDQKAIVAEVLTEQMCRRIGLIG